MKQFEWKTFEELTANHEDVYINPCCEFCDIVLERIRPILTTHLNMKLDDLVIMQEDWGWLMEIKKDDIFYEIDLSYAGKDDENAHNFGAVFVAKKIKKGFLLTRKTEAEDECEKFSEIVNKIASDNNFLIS